MRVVRFAPFSTELCGGCHVLRTGQIGLCKITTEGGVSAGVRRIEAVTGAEAVDRVQAQESLLNAAAQKLRVSADNLLLRVDQEIDRGRELEREVTRLQQKLASQAGSELSDSAVEIAGVKILAARVDEAAGSLRETVDQLKNKLGEAVVVLAAGSDGKVKLVAGVTGGTKDKVRAGELVNFVAEQVGGRGGGRADFAQAGGTDIAGLPAALESVEHWVRERLEE